MTEPNLDALPSDAGVSSLTAIGRKLLAAEEKVQRLEAELKRACLERDKIQNHELPEIAEALGIEGSFGVDGCKLEIKPILSVKPLEANRPLVLQELEKQGAGALIKNEVTVSFTKGKEKEAAEFIARLQAEGLQPKTERWVESQTLKKHVDERLKAGKSVDLELFGVRQFKQAKFTDGAPKPRVFDGE